MRLIATALLLCAAAAGPWHLETESANEPLRLQTRQAAVRGVVSGVVLDRTNAGLSNVTVQLLRDGAVVATTTTGAGGEFTFEGVAAGLYEVRAVRADLAPESVRVAVGDLPVPRLRLSLIAPATAAARNPRETRPSPPAPPSADNARTAAAGRGGRAAPEAARPSSSHEVPSLALPHPVASPVPMHSGRVDAEAEAYARFDDNRFRRVAEAPVSTFSIDVDTASYSNVRRFLNEGRLPPADAVRVEELINYFRYAYPDRRGDAPFGVTTELAACPWNPRHKLALVGIHAPRDERPTPPRNLVFLLDVSGSMLSADKLPLVKTAMRMLVDTLTPADRVAIVVYAGASGVALRSTPGDRKAEINGAIAELRAGGSTNGAAGIRLAYDLAAAGFIEEGVNRVILATDGDFNVGVTSQNELVRMIEHERTRGIFLSVLGVGTGNLKDATMEMLADKGNGNYAYLDSLQEARRVLIEEAGATLVTVAKDVKVQIEFNPRLVGAYRLVGYENRLLAREDFNDDAKDAGEMGAGHTVTALYELVPPGESYSGGSIDPLVYQPEASRPQPAAGRAGELMNLKIRYKQPAGQTSHLLTVPVRNGEGELTANLGFAAAVAEFGMLLRQSAFKGQATWHSAQELARRFRGSDADGYRAEFIRLLDLAAALAPERRRH